MRQYCDGTLKVGGTAVTDAERWEQRARKVQAKRDRVAKHGRSLLTAIPQAERKRALELERRAALRENKARRGK